MCCAVKGINPTFLEKAGPALTGILMVLILLLACLLFPAESGAVMEPLDAPFSGSGSIERFDISESGEIVISVSRELSYDRYIMVFDIDGRFLRGVRHESHAPISAMFRADGAVVFFRQKSQRLQAFDTQWNLLEEYEDPGLNRFRPGNYRGSFHGVTFYIDPLKSKLVGIRNDEEFPFYEIENHNLLFRIGFVLFLLLTSLIVFCVGKAQSGTSAASGSASASEAPL